jgi:hypothetical protein
MGKHSSKKTRRIEGGMTWTAKTEGVDGWEAKDGSLIILYSNGYVVLVSIDHETNEESQELWRERFDTLEEAMTYAEGI